MYLKFMNLSVCVNAKRKKKYKRKENFILLIYVIYIYDHESNMIMSLMKNKKTIWLLFFQSNSENVFFDGAISKMPFFERVIIERV